MAKTKKTDIPHIAVDTNIIMALAEYDKHGEDIRKVLENNYYKTTEVIELFKHNYYMKKEFGYIDEKEGNEKLEFIAQLYYHIRRGKIKLYITKTILGELGLVPKQLFKGKNAGKLYKSEALIKDFIENEDNNVTVLTVAEEDAEQFAIDKLRLATEYVEAGAMGKEYDPRLEDYYPSIDALIMAEVSLFGLYFITLNEKHFLHNDCNANDGKGDFEKATKIEEVNLNYGLRFPTNRKPYKDPPKPISLSSFIFRYKLRFKEAKAFYTYPNINEETNEIMYNPLSNYGV